MDQPPLFVFCTLIIYHVFTIQQIVVSSITLNPLCTQKPNLGFRVYSPLSIVRAMIVASKIAPF